MAIKLPNTPTTSDILQEYLPKGVGSVLGKGIDLSGLKANQDVISSAINFYDEFSDAINTTAPIQRRTIVARYLQSESCEVAESPYNESLIVVLSEGVGVLTTADASKALELVEATESATYYCSESKTEEGALAEAVA